MQQLSYTFTYPPLPFTIDNFVSLHLRSPTCTVCFFCGAIVTHYSFSFSMVDHHCWITESTGWPFIEVFFFFVWPNSQMWWQKKISHFISQKQSAPFVSPKGVFTIITWIIANSNANQPGQIAVAMWHTDSSLKKTSKLFAILIPSSMTKSTWAADMKLKMKTCQ